MWLGTTNKDNDFVTRKDLEKVKRSGIKQALVTGSETYTISNFSFSKSPALLLENKIFVMGISSLNIVRVNNVDAGYILYNSTDKKFYLKGVATDLSKEADDMYFISLLWNNGVYTENGLLKNQDLETLKLTTNQYVLTLTSNSEPRPEMRRMMFTYGKIGMLKLDFVWSSTSSYGSIATLPNNAPTFNGLVEVQGSGDIVVYVSANSRNVMVQGATKGKRYIINLFGFLN